MDPQLKSKILQKLKARNTREIEGYAQLIQAHNKLFEFSDTYKTKNVTLTVEVERLKRENLDLQVKVETGGGGSGGKLGEKTQALEQKCFQLQSELTELLRTKGQNAQQIIDLNNSLQEKERELAAKNYKIHELENTIQGLREANKNLEQNLIEATTTNQMLTDEQQALQLAFTSLEEKHRKALEDNNDLVKRWMEFKARDANKLNAENDAQYQKQQTKIKKELQEAANEKVDIKIKEVHLPDFSPPVCFNVVVPTKALHKFDGHDGEVNCVRWSPSGRVFATGGSDRKLKLWEVSGGKCDNRGILLGSNAAIMSIDFDYGESLILAASNDFASRVWTLSDQRLRHTLTGHSGKVLAAKFLGDPGKVVSGSHDRTLKIWDLRSKACIKTIFAGSSCNDIVTSDGLGTNIISGHFDKKIRFWDTRSECSAKEILLQGRVTALDIAADKVTLLSCSRDDSIKLIDLRMNQVAGTLSSEGFHVSCDWSRAVFSPDGQYVIAGSNDGALFVWNTKNNHVEKVLREHHNSVLACSWHPQGSSILSCDKQRKVTYWADF